MREKLMYVLAAAAAALLTWNLYKIFFVLPPTANVAAYQIVYFHVPAAFTALSGFFIALAASGLYLAPDQVRFAHAYKPRTLGDPSKVAEAVEMIERRVNLRHFLGGEHMQSIGPIVDAAAGPCAAFLQITHKAFPVLSVVEPRRPEVRQ